MLSTQARHWRSAAAALQVVRHRVEPTRQELGGQLGLGSGPTSDLVKRLRAARLVVERPRAGSGPGRPTTTLHAHPEGPVALVVNLRHGDWRLGVCGIDGAVRPLESHRHNGDPDALLSRVRAVVGQAARRLSARVVAVGVAVPGQTDGVRLLHASMLGWRDIDLTGIGAAANVDVVVGNDATMAAIAEARVRRPRPRVLLHLVAEVGIGGALIVDGRPVESARGLQGEYGHLPFGDPHQRCPCGAYGCWGIAFDARHVADRMGRPAPADPRDWMARLLADDHPAAAAQQVRQDLATRLGRGTAGLVNALDPDTVTLGGLAGPVQAAAPEHFEHAYRDGLMSLHRDRPPMVGPAEADTNAVLAGAALVAFDHALDAGRLARWAAIHGDNAGQADARTASTV